MKLTEEKKQKADHYVKQQLKVKNDQLAEKDRLIADLNRQLREKERFLAHKEDQAHDAIIILRRENRELQEKLDAASSLIGVA